MRQWQPFRTSLLLEPRYTQLNGRALAPVVTNFRMSSVARLLSRMLRAVVGCYSCGMVRLWL